MADEYLSVFCCSVSRSGADEEAAALPRRRVGTSRLLENEADVTPAHNMDQITCSQVFR